MSYPENIARTRNARAEHAVRLVTEARNRLRHAATLLTNAPTGFPIGDPEAELVAATIRSMANDDDPANDGRDFETLLLEIENLYLQNEED